MHAIILHVFLLFFYIARLLASLSSSSVILKFCPLFFINLCNTLTLCVCFTTFSNGIIFSDSFSILLYSSSIFSKSFFLYCSSQFFKYFSNFSTELLCSSNSLFIWLVILSNNTFFPFFII